jgi:hypothetical protein
VLNGLILDLNLQNGLHKYFVVRVKKIRKVSSLCNKHNKSEWFLQFSHFVNGDKYHLETIACKISHVSIRLARCYNHLCFLLIIIEKEDNPLLYY